MKIVVPLELYPKGPAVAAPTRRPGSIRRTSTIDSVWPEGIEANRTVVGRSRDLFTPLDGSNPVVLAEDALFVTVAPDRGIVAMEAVPAREGIKVLSLQFQKKLKLEHRCIYCSTTFLAQRLSEVSH